VGKGPLSNKQSANVCRKAITSKQSMQVLFLQPETC